MASSLLTATKCPMLWLWLWLVLTAACRTVVAESTARTAKKDTAPFHPPMPDVVRGPIHSWDTVPVSFHGCRPNTRGPTGLEFLPEDLEALKRYRLITIEKWQGTNAFSTDVCRQEHPVGNFPVNKDPCEDSSSSAKSNVFYWEDDAWISAAKQIKAVNPTASIAVWMDTMLIYTGWSWPPPSRYTDENLNRTWNPDISVPCSTGYFRPAEFLEQHPDFLLKNTSGLPALESWSHCHIYDYTQERV